MKEHTSILGTIQLILSQLREPFDLQKFIELVDQENWSEEAANFMALRETLLTRLLSPTLEEPHEDWRMTVVDLTDPILCSTGLDSSIMDVALHNFVQSPGGRKLIVLNNCHQYLAAKCSLSKTLEALVGVVGNDRPASVILSTTDPTMVSFPILNTSDYVVSTLSRSFQWNAFLRKHFTESEIPTAQRRTGRAMIWSPESIMCKPYTSKDSSEAKRLWGRRLSFINIEQFERTMPPELPPGNPESITNVDDYEEGMVALDRSILEEGSDTIASHEPAMLSPISAQGQANESSSTLASNKATSTCSSQPTMINQSQPMADPHHHVSTIATTDTGRPHEKLRVSDPTTIDAVDNPRKHFPVISAILGLTSGDANAKVRLINLHNSLLQIHREGDVVRRFICEAKKGGVVLQEKDKTGAIWLWINNAANVRPSIPPNSPHSPSPPVAPANVEQYGGRGHGADLAQHKVEPHPTMKPNSVPPDPIGHDIPNPTASAISVPFVLADIIPNREKSHSADAMLKDVEPIYLSETNHSGTEVLRSPPPEVTALPPSSPTHAPQSVPTPLLARVISKQSIGLGAGDSFPTPSPPPAARVVAAPPPQPKTSHHTVSTIVTAASCPPKHRAVVAILIALTAGVPGKKVRMEEWMDSLRHEYPGARETFLLSLIAEAEEDGMMTRARNQKGVVSAWLNVAKDIRPGPGSSN